MKKYLLNSRYVALIPLLVLLAGCTKVEVKEADLIEPDKIQAKEANYVTEQCRLGDLSREYSYSAQFYYPRDEELYFTDKGILKEYFVTSGDYVEKGTLLAELTFNDTSLDSKIQQKQIEYESMLREFQTNKDNRLESIAQMKTQQGNDKITAVKIRKAEADYDFFLYESDRNLEKKRNELSELIQKNEGLKLYAPFDGRVTLRPSMLPGKLIESGEVILNLRDESVYQLAAEFDPQAIRYNQLVNVEVARLGTVEGRVASDGTVTGENAQYFVVDAVEKPEGIGDFDRRTIKLLIKPFEISNVMIISNRAIRNEDDKRYVYILEDQIAKKRYVQVGLNTSEYSQILDGLKLTDTVVLN